MEIKDYAAIRITLEVEGGDSPSKTVFEISNPKQKVVTELQLGVIHMAEQFAMAHSK